MIPNDVIEKAQAAIDQEMALETPWANGAIQVVPQSHSWVAKKQSFDAAEFMFTMDFDYNGSSYTIYHAPRTGKYNI